MTKYVVKYVVKYIVDGYGPQQAGPYDTYQEARTHRDDIQSFEGVTDVKIEEVLS